MHKLITFNVEAGASRGRIEITDNQFKNFVEAHLIDDYEWIFNELKDKAGEVISR